MIILSKLSNRSSNAPSSTIVIPIFFFGGAHHTNVIVQRTRRRHVVNYYSEFRLRMRLDYSSYFLKMVVLQLICEQDYVFIIPLRD